MNMLDQLQQLLIYINWYVSQLSSLKEFEILQCCYTILNMSIHGRALGLRVLLNEFSIFSRSFIKLQLLQTDIEVNDSLMCDEII